MALKCKCLHLQKERYEEVLILLQEKTYKSWRAKEVL